MSLARHSQRRFKVDIVVVFCALVVTTVVIISGYTYYKMVETTRSITNELIDRVSHAVIEKTAGYLQPAQGLAEIVPSILQGREVALEFGTELERLFIEIIKHQPQIDQFYYGNEQGELLMVSKNSNPDLINSKSIDRSGESPLFHYRVRNLQGDIVEDREGSDELYDPRERPWYLGARKVGGTYWTDLYIFHANTKLGITVAVPVLDKGVFRGVIAADMTLDGLSHFLQGLDLSANGVVFILNRHRQFVAFPDAERLVEQVEDSYRPVLAVELNERWITDGIRNFEDSGEESFSYSSGKQRYYARFTPFPPAFGKEWMIVAMLPEDDFLGSIDSVTLKIVVISAIILLIAILLGLYFSRNLSRPIERLTREVEQIHRFQFSDEPALVSHIKEIQTMSDSFEAMKHALKAFRLFVPADLVRQLIESGEEVKPGGKEREVTLFFSDIEGFTTIAEQIPARELLVDLSDYFEGVTGVIAAEGGTVDKYIGDAVMALWGAPIGDEEHALHACRAALRCQREIAHFNQQRMDSGKSPFKTRIGIHTGFSIVGNMGSSERLNYTALGDNVNLASRLEGLNKRYRTSIIISQGSYRYVRQYFLLRPLDHIAVVGKSNSVLIYELMGDGDSENYELLKKRAELSTQAYNLYLQREWAQALELYNELLQLDADDGPVAIFIERCKNLLENDPGSGWSGHVRLNRGDYVMTRDSQ